MKKSIEFQIFETPQKTPTCSIGTKPNQSCKLLLSTRMGLEFKCAYTQENIERENVTGYMQPCKGCPLHKK